MKLIDSRHGLFLALLCACPAEDPDVGDTGTTEPSTTGPSTTEPSTTEPSTTEPSTTEPSTTEPSTTEPSTTEPSTTESSTTEPSTTDADSSTTDAETSTTDDPTGGDAVVVLNELSSNNDGKLGEDPIELYNAGNGAVDISGWIITDDTTEPYDPKVDEEEYVFPDGTMLDGGAFLVVVGGDLPDGHPFGLSGDGDTVRLIDPDLAVVDEITYAAEEAAVSYCRMPDGPDGVWQADCTETFGASNG